MPWGPHHAQCINEFVFQSTQVSKKSCDLQEETSHLTQCKQTFVNFQCFYVNTFYDKQDCESARPAIP